MKDVREAVRIARICQNQGGKRCKTSRGVWNGTKPLVISEESTTMKGGRMKTRTTTIKSRSKIKDLLLRHPNFVAKSIDASFETSPLACEASALTTELTARN